MRKATLFRKKPDNSVVGMWTKGGQEIWIATYGELKNTYLDIDRKDFINMLQTKKLITSLEGREFLKSANL